ncbi:MAG: response regulator [Candidatus Omnitrophica bacterium]|nr:response regulator [Candidatus Omnitrophota bacterium]
MSQVKDKTILSQHYKTAKPKPTILIIDDEKAIREYFVKALADYQVLTASSGEEGLALIEKTRPDVVLLDLRMPGLSGIDTLKRIKAFDKSIPVIILSAFADLETSIEAARLGAFTSIAKPFDLEEMKKVLEAARQK